LQQTASAMLGKRGVDGRTRFCVDANGRVDAVSIVESSGDPEVDRVLAATVRGWRFAPMRVDGRPRKTCSSASFDIHFE
jgi:TonB family protein